MQSILADYNTIVQDFDDDDDEEYLGQAWIRRWKFHNTPISSSLNHLEKLKEKKIKKRKFEEDSQLNQSQHFVNIRSISSI